MSDELRIELDEGRTTFSPDEVIRGRAIWMQSGVVQSARVCLVWYTEGKGTRDMDVAHDASLPVMVSSSGHPFELTAPAEGPFSFSGKLISLLWAVELVIEPGGKTVQQSITISPTGLAIDLYAGASDAST